MGKETKISWTDSTWNPTTGCDKIAAGCDNCYALTAAAKMKAQGAKRYQTDGDPRTSGPGFGVAMHRDALTIPKSWPTPRMVFVNSMSDLFHAGVDLGFVADVFDVMRETPQHTYQVLTKRASRLPRLVDRLDWPANLWMGVSIENEEAMARIEPLKAVPVSVRFLSAEPLIGPLPGLADHLDGIDWVIAGGESGIVHRPLNLDWARGVRDACATSATAFFFKQVGGTTSKAGGNVLDGAVVEQWPNPDPSRLRGLPVG